MSFDINKSVDKNDKIFYNYPQTTLYSYEKTPENGGYIKMPYSSTAHNPNISSTIFDSAFKTERLYITKKIHSFGKDIDYDAELIIEHLPITNGYKKLYTCFLLKTGSQKSICGLDDILSTKKTELSIHLNSCISHSQKCVIYESEGMLWNDVVLVFTTPILVGSQFTQFNEDIHLFSPFNENYSMFSV